MVTMVARLFRTVLLLLVFLIYFYLLVKVILFKFSGFEPHYVSTQFFNCLRQPEILWDRLQARGNLIPFHEIANNLVHIFLAFNLLSLINFFGNIVAFVPLGFLLPLLSRTKPIHIGTVALISFLVSLGFELTQLVLSIGTFDVDDLLLNTSGGASGFLLLKLVRFMIKTSWHKQQMSQLQGQKL